MWSKCAGQSLNAMKSVGCISSYEHSLGLFISTIIEVKDPAGPPLVIISWSSLGLSLI